MFDNVADNEVDSTGGMTPPEELALAITMLSSGVAIAHETAAIAATGAAARSVLQLQINSIAASAGQFLDAYLQRTECTSTEQSLRMTTLKSGSIGRLAGEFAASMATEDREIIDGFAEFGFDLFSYLQLVDDLRDAMPENSEIGDLSQGKRTLPIVFFYNTVESSKAIEHKGVIIAVDSEQQLAEIRRQFATSGSMSFCAIVAEAYLNRSKSDLEKLKPKVVTVESLEQLVSTLEFAAEEVSLAS
jgi:geranylgeranyl pyrophosphate synthase